MHVSRRLGLVLPLALAALMTAPAAAPAATVHSFANAQDLLPAGDANGTIGPANHYPSSIAVAGLDGTVIGAKAELIDLESGRAEDIDMALEGPNGAVTMLMSDACGDHGVSHVDWTFEDAAPSFLSQLSCAGAGTDFKPTNYFEEGRGDDLSADGGPEGPYLNSLVALTGGTPDGNWNLYAIDDSAGVVGFGIGGWELVLEVEPPPPPPPAPPAEPPAPPVGPVMAPAGAPIVTAAIPVAPVRVAAKTGKRAKALKRCKAKKSNEARRGCRRAAKKLPR